MKQTILNNLEIIKAFIKNNFDELSIESKTCFYEDVNDHLFHIVHNEIPFVSYKFPEHVPLRETRIDVMGEVVFTKHWLELMDSEPEYNYNTKLEQILNNISYTGRITQRDATVAISLVQWLGTNCGYCIISEARRLIDKGIQDPFFVEWSRQNIRKTMLNNGRTYVEHVCNKTDEYNKVSLRDMEVCNIIMIWFGTKEGLEFLENVDKEIEIRQDAVRIERRLENQRKYNNVTA